MYYFSKEMPKKQCAILMGKVYFIIIWMLLSWFDKGKGKWYSANDSAGLFAPHSYKLMKKGAARMNHAMRTALCVLLGIACAMAFVLSSDGFVGVSDLPSSSTSVLWSALAAVFAWLFWRVLVLRKLRLTGGSIIFGLLFGVVNAFATTLFAYDSWSFLQGAAAWGKMLLRCIGQALPMMAALRQHPCNTPHHRYHRQSLGQWSPLPRSTHDVPC